MFYLHVRLPDDGWGRDLMGIGLVGTEDLGETISTISRPFHEYSLQPISSMRVIAFRISLLLLSNQTTGLVPQHDRADRRLVGTSIGFVCPDPSAEEPLATPNVGKGDAKRKSRNKQMVSALSDEASAASGWGFSRWWG